jgi:LysM repeat protein
VKRAPYLSILVLTLLIFSGCARVQKPSTLPAPRPAAGGLFHSVERGQTLYRIAKNYRVDVRDLMRANHISDPSQLEVGQKLVIPSGGVAPAPVIRTAGRGMDADEISRLIGVKKPGYWKTITVHHSATRQGGAAPFHRDHVRRRMGGLFYHFVIGNGSLTRNGEVEVGFRWKKQIKANRPYDIQICLVGDFSKNHVSQAQLDSTVNLIRVLMNEYHIPRSAVRKHEDIKGKHTQCPGRYFPFQELLNELSRS